MPFYCQTCGRALTPDEIGATKKLVNRGATRFWCVCCLADRFEVTQKDILDKIEQFKEMGCTLFARNPAPQAARSPKATDNSNGGV